MEDRAIPAPFLFALLLYTAMVGPAVEALLILFSFHLSSLATLPI